MHNTTLFFFAVLELGKRLIAFLWWSFVTDSLNWRTHANATVFHFDLLTVDVDFYLFSWVVLFFNYFKLTLLVRALTFIFNLTIVLVFFFWQDRCVFDLTYVFYRFLFFLNFTFVNCWCKLQFMFARSSLNDALLNWWLFIRGLDVTNLIDRLVGCQNLAFTFVLLFASTLLFTFDALWASRLYRLCRFHRLLRLPRRLWRHRSRTLPCNSSWWFFVTFLFAFKRPLRL